MISIKDRPRHLSVRPISIRNDYPLSGFCLERIVMIAELDDRNIEFEITLLRSNDAKTGNIEIVGEVPNMPEKGTTYIIGERNDIIAKIGEQMDVIRRSQKSDVSILDWLAKRVLEYANSRIL
jgi:glutaredoxin 2